MSFRLAPNEEPLPGYRLIERLGRGGFGEVWECEAPGGIHKAIKFVYGDLDSDDEDGRPAEQELKSLNRVKAIRHPYILSIERYDIIDGQLMIVMELADRNLWDRYKDCRGLGMGGVPRDELLGYLFEAAEALDLMNDRYQIQHLDIKPQNLFLIHNHLKVADFGLAKDLEGGRGTITGGVTPVYAGPETFDGYASRFTDQYSLAIVFQELLTGTRPFPGPSTKELVMQHLREPPVLDALSPADRAVIARALEKRPDDRWPSCTELVRQLKQATDAPPPGSRAISPAGARPAPPPGSRATAFPSPRPARTPLPPPTHGLSAGPTPPSGRAGLPALVAPGNSGLSSAMPRLVTPQAVGGVPAATMAGGGVASVQTARMSTLGLAPPERNEAGILVPALIVGVGKTGLQVLRAVRRITRDRFGSEPMTHLRFLYIDTDPDTVAAATDPASPDRLAPHEAVLARLQRPAHYLQDGKPNPEQWLPPGMLYRLPREPAPANGTRAFGRLALVDNAKAVAQRVRQAVEAFLSDDAIDAAAGRTGLGVRTNRGRAYLAAGLAGGTGGGMFLDLAYLLKSELRMIGYLKPEVIGLLFTPPATVTGPKGAGLANAYAGLAELAHFQGAGTRYTAPLVPGEPAIVDADGPFARTAVFPLPSRPSDPETAKAAGLAGRAVALDLFTPVGRATDAARGTRKPGTVQPIGLYRLSWPRADLLTLAAGRFAQKVMQRWAAREAPHQRDVIAQWLDAEWVKRKLTTDNIVGQFDAAVAAQLRGNPEAVFDALVDPLAARGSGSGRLDAEGVVQVLDQVVKFVGKPDAEGAGPGTLHEHLLERQKKLAADADAQLSALTVSFIEHPQFRLGGADEGLGQVAARLERAADDLDAVRHDLHRDVRDTYGRMFPLIGGLSAATGLGVIGARKGGMTAELVELLRAYPRKRLRLIVLDATLSVVRGLIGAIPECRRDVNLCRARLTELAAGLTATPPVPVGPGKMLLPHGVGGMDAAADVVLAAISPAEISGFEGAAQAAVKAKFKMLVDACLSASYGPALATLLTGLAREFLDARLESADPAEVFFRYKTDPAAATKLLADAFAAAAPAVAAGGRAEELVLLAGPAGEAGDRLRHEASAAVGVPLRAAPLADDIVFVRECPHFPTSALPQLGPAGREAFDAQVQTGATPHARADVPWPSAEPRPAEPSRY